MLKLKDVIKLRVVKYKGFVTVWAMTGAGLYTAMRFEGTPTEVEILLLKSTCYHALKNHLENNNVKFV